MSRKRKSIISLVTVALLSMCLALPVFAKAEARLPAGTCEKCGKNTVVSYTVYGSWQFVEKIWHTDHYDVKYIRNKYIETKCNNCGYTTRIGNGHETKVTCPWKNKK